MKKLNIATLIFTIALFLISAGAPNALISIGK